MNMFRTLTANEIECRVQQMKANGLSLLLYKDARCDQNILDETVGPMNWMRSHCRDNANCIVSIWDEGKRQWISKEDTGTESNTEAQKGLASDSFKRACFNWGIGRELYTAPFIWITSDKYKVDDKGRLKDRFSVGSIEYENGFITALTIVNEKSGNEVFSYRKGSPKSEQSKSQHKQPNSNKKQTPRQMLINRLNELGIDINTYATEHGLNGKTDNDTFMDLLEELNHR